MSVYLIQRLRVPSSNDSVSLGSEAALLPAGSLVLALPLWSLTKRARAFYHQPLMRQRTSSLQPRTIATGLRDTVTHGIKWPQKRHILTAQEMIWRA